MSGHLSPIQLDSYRPLRELVCETIRQAIVDGVFSPGERLMEIQLADEMGVSRTPVRQLLAQEVTGIVRAGMTREGPRLPSEATDDCRSRRSSRRRHCRPTKAGAPRGSPESQGSWHRY